MTQTNTAVTLIEPLAKAVSRPRETLAFETNAPRPWPDSLQIS